MIFFIVRIKCILLFIDGHCHRLFCYRKPGTVSLIAMEWPFIITLICIFEHTVLESNFSMKGSTQEHPFCVLTCWNYPGDAPSLFFLWTLVFFCSSGCLNHFPGVLVAVCWQAPITLAGDSLHGFSSTVTLYSLHWHFGFMSLPSTHCCDCLRKQLWQHGQEIGRN